MILTCPSCGTQYAVKDGAIPPQGRQVRCASCKHAWHQDPEQSPGAEAAPDAQAEPRRDETIAEAAMIEPRSGPEAEERAFVEASLGGGDAGEAVSHEIEQDDEGDDARAAAQVGLTPGIAPVAPMAPPADPLVEDARTGGGEWSPPIERDLPPEETAHDEDFSPFAMEEDDEPRGRGAWSKLLIAVLLIAALAAAFWFLAPPEWKERVGLTAAGETPLQLMMTHSDRQKLASGNELLAVSGRVINPTDKRQDVPPIRAQLRSSSGKLVYSWTIAPPARTLGPGDSRTFNSAEVNVPPGGDELTITLGSAKT